VLQDDFPSRSEAIEAPGSFPSLQVLHMTLDDSDFLNLQWLWPSFPNLISLRLHLYFGQRRRQPLGHFHSLRYNLIPNQYELPIPRLEQLYATFRCVPRNSTRKELLDIFTQRTAAGAHSLDLRKYENFDFSPLSGPHASMGGSGSPIIRTLVVEFQKSRPS